MAAMGTPEQAMHRHVVEIRGRSQRLAWFLWILVSVIGAVLGALAASQVRTLATTPDTVGYGLRYVAIVVDAILLSGAQWFLLRHYKLEAHWWVPASVAANLVATIVVIPGVFNLGFGPTGTSIMTPGRSIVFGAAALAAGGLVVGIAQALVLRASAGNIAWAWIPATIIGGGLAGALTSAVAAQLFGLPYVMIISAVAAIGALLAAASQGPVFLRLLR